MKYNEDGINSNIKWYKSHGTTIKEKVVEIDHINRYRETEMGKECDVVQLVTTDGECYTNHYETWQQQLIDVEALQKGAQLEITYADDYDFELRIYKPNGFTLDLSGKRFFKAEIIDLERDLDNI